MFLALYVGAQTLVADLRNKVRGEDGAVATEYALLLVLIALAIIAAAIALLFENFTNVFLRRPALGLDISDEDAIATLSTIWKKTLYGF